MVFKFLRNKLFPVSWKQRLQFFEKQFFMLHGEVFCISSLYFNFSGKNFSEPQEVFLFYDRGISHFLIDAFQFSSWSFPKLREERSSNLREMFIQVFRRTLLQLQEELSLFLRKKFSSLWEKAFLNFYEKIFPKFLLICFPYFFFQKS